MLKPKTIHVFAHAGVSELEGNGTHSKKPSILIVDDDKSLVGSFQKFFEMKEFDVEAACSGYDAAMKITGRDFDVALIDIALPDMRGTELLLKFRKTIPGTRKIILTGFANTENAIEAVNNGASFFLAKPVRLDKLLDVVNKQLEERERECLLCRQKWIDSLASREGIYVGGCRG
jgi:DNA-binding NtrC family response regulator